jgi:hypothetical protein
MLARADLLAVPVNLDRSGTNPPVMPNNRFKRDGPAARRLTGALGDTNDTFAVSH